MKHRRLKLLHHSHTGAHRAHEHTSYTALLLLLTMVGASLTTFTSTAFLASPGPETVTIGLSGTLPADPPTVVATLATKDNRDRYTSTPVGLHGSCTEGMLVEIYKNNIFAGSTVCKNDGTYDVDIDLLIGQNVLTAYIYDALNQSGPVSESLTVFYDAQITQGQQLSALSFGGDQLVVNTDAVFRGTFPNQDMSVPINILGGRAPYAFNVQWGDATNKVVSRPTNEDFRINHTYTKAGTYNLSIQATDADGRVAFLTVAAIVNGQPYAAGAGTTDGTGAANTSVMQRLLVLWPVYIGAVVMVVSFWLGEQREKKILSKHMLPHHA